MSDQTDTVALLRSDPDTSEDEHFRIMLVQTEAERVRFVVRAYVRTRLSKVGLHLSSYKVRLDGLTRATWQVRSNAWHVG